MSDARSPLRAFRRRIGLTQDELAIRCDMSVRAIRDMEHGRVSRPHDETLHRVAAVLCLNQTELFELQHWLRTGIQATAVRLGVLGPLTVTVQGVDTPVTGAGTRAALGLLALDPNHPVGMDQLAAIVWRDKAPKTWETQIHAAISRLRRILASTPSTVPAILRVPSGYQLRISENQLDLMGFRAAMQQGSALRGTDRLAALDAYTAGVALWRGAVCGDDELLRHHPSVVGATSEYTDALVAMADLAAELGAHERVIGALQHATALEPYHEGLHQRLMVAMAARGDRAGAARVFIKLRQRLVDELGLEPARDLQEVHQRILRDDALPSGSAAGGPVAPRLLPADIGDFTGRQHEVDALVAALDAGHMATVSGMAGVGKTALTLHVAHRIAHDYPDGQLYIDLHGTRPGAVEPGEVLGRFLRALGVDPRAVPQGAADREDLYRSLLARRRVLVVLDNAADLEQVRPLLPGGGHCAVVVTSRARLSGLGGGSHVELDVFEMEQAVDLLARIATPQRVSAQPDAALEIVRLCGSLPLAVRIAAARLAARPTWPLEHMATQLRSERFRLDRLALGDLAVRASLTLSYDGLSSSAASLLRRLALFDSADHPMWFVAAVAGCPMEQALSDIDELVDAQLLIDAGIDANAQSRYRLHDLVRLFGREQATIADPLTDQERALRLGLGAWLAVAEKMALSVPGPCFAVLHGTATRTAVDWIAANLVDVAPQRWFDLEWAALRSGIAQACRTGLDELAYDLAGCLEKYLDIRGMHGEWRAMNEQVLTVCKNAGNVRGEAAMLRGLIDVRTWNPAEPTDNAMSRQAADAEKLQALFDQVGEVAGAADAAVMAAWGHAAHGDVAAAHAAATHGLLLAESAGHVGGQARARVAIALTHRESGQVEQALPELHTALDLAQSLGNTRYEATVQQFLGVAHLETGNLDEATSALDKSLDIARYNHDQYVEAFSLLTTARIQVTRADPAARETAALACDISRRFNMSHHLADALAILGGIELAQQRYRQAVTYLEESEQIWQTRGWESYHSAVRADLDRARQLAAAASEPNST